MKIKKSNLKNLVVTLSPLLLATPFGAYALSQDNAGLTAFKALAVAISPATATTISANNNNIPGSQNLNPVVYQKALQAYHSAVNNGEVQNKKVLTIVDFSLPSYDKRMWVVDPNTGKVLMNLYTAQGMNSGVTYAKHFSNQSGSHESCLGAFVTANTYDGKHGLSLRIKGLDQGINNNAMERAVIIHPAAYMTPAFIKAHHRAGRSWGCFAVNPAKSKQLINLTKDGSVIYAFAPHQDTGV